MEAALRFGARLQLATDHRPLTTFRQLPNPFGHIPRP